MRTTVGIKLTGLLFAIAAVAACAADLDHWERVMSPSIYRHWHDVTYGGGLFVAVGETSTLNGTDGEIFTSVDGAHWTRQNSGIVGQITGITYGGNTFVAVGSAHTGPYTLILTSPDGTNWTRRAAPVNWHLFDVSYGNLGFVAVGDMGISVSSPDGVTWVDRSLQPLDNILSLQAIAQSGDGVVAVGGMTQPYHGVILTSSEWSRWTRLNLGNARLYDVAYGNGRFVAVGEYDTILRSTDRRTWTPSSLGAFPPNHLTAITFGEGQFVAVGPDGQVISSTDAITWARHRAGTTELLNGVACGNGTCVVISYNDGVIMRTQSPNRPPVAIVDVSPTADSLSAPPLYVVISPNNTDAAVTLNGTGSSDPDGDALNFLWLRYGPEGSTIEIARNPQTLVVLPLGQHNFTLRVSDRLETDTQEFQVRIITASEALDLVAALLDGSDLHRGDKQPLLSSVRTTQRPFEEGDIESGLHHLDRLQRKIEARLSATNPDLAQTLIAILNDIRAAFPIEP